MGEKVVFRAWVAVLTVIAVAAGASMFWWGSRPSTYVLWGRVDDWWMYVSMVVATAAGFALACTAAVWGLPRLSGWLGMLAKGVAVLVVAALTIVLGFLVMASSMFNGGTSVALASGSDRVVLVFDSVNSSTDYARILVGREGGMRYVERPGEVTQLLMSDCRLSSAERLVLTCGPKQIVLDRAPS